MTDEQVIFGAVIGLPLIGLILLMVWFEYGNYRHRKFIAALNAVQTQKELHDLLKKEGKL